MVFLTAGFARETTEDRLDLNSLQGQTKANELGTPRLELLSLRLALRSKALQVGPFCTKNSRETAEPRVHREGADALLKNRIHLY